MVIKFPSGHVSINIRELRSNPYSQLTCGVCDKPWIIGSDGCIKKQLHVLHPCQHLVGSGCWSSLPDEHKDKCPVCKVGIRCNEKVRVHSHAVHVVPASQDSVAKSSGLEKEKPLGQAQHVIVENAENKMKVGLNDVDVRAIMYYMNLRARLDAVKDNLCTLSASIKTLTPTHRERLVLFLANTPQNNQDSMQRKVEVALSAFNISGGTSFTMNDLRKILSSAEEWIKKHFAAILKDNEQASREASSVRILEKRLADVEAELKELKDRQSRESGQQLRDEIQLATEEIIKKANEELAKVFAKAEKEVVEICAKAKEEYHEAREFWESDEEVEGSGRRRAT